MNEIVPVGFTPALGSHNNDIIQIYRNETFLVCKCSIVLGSDDLEVKTYVSVEHSKSGIFLSFQRKRDRVLYTWSRLRNNDSAKQHNISCRWHISCIFFRVTRSVKTSLRSNISPPFLCGLSEFRAFLCRLNNTSVSGKNMVNMSY